MLWAGVDSGSPQSVAGSNQPQPSPAQLSVLLSYQFRSAISWFVLAVEQERRNLGAFVFKSLGETAGKTDVVAL